MAVKWKSKISWRAKLEKPQEPRIVNVPPRMRNTWGPGRMVIATPSLIDGLVRKVPKGRLVTVSQIMHRLARDHKCDSTCPMTTGIFLRIVAETAEEDAAAGRKRITPYWRVLKSDGSLNDKYPGGVAHHAGYLKAEGHRVVKVGARLKVDRYEARLAKL